MATFEEHCRDCREQLGEEYPHVHLWLDELAGKPPWGMRHRRFRHHAAGIEEAVSLFGEGARAAARLHVERDLSTEGWTAADSFPRTEAEYVKMGFW